MFLVAAKLLLLVCTLRPACGHQGHDFSQHWKKSLLQIVATPDSTNDSIQSDVDKVHYNGVVWTRAMDTDCNAEKRPPVVRLASLPNTGTTWLQYLFEEMTHYATQNPQTIPQVHPLQPYVLMDESVTLRAQCGAQLSMHDNCTRKEWKSLGMRLAKADEMEMFKTHYPVLSGKAVLFETTPSAPKTLVLVRNPVDAFLAQSRHVSADDESKVGAELKVGAANLGTSNYISMRKSTIMHGIDPLDILSRPPHENGFQNFLVMWVDFFRFWLSDAASICAEVTFVRYEDLCNMNLTADVLEELLSITGMVAVAEDAVENAVKAYPPNISRLGKNVYFNKTLALDSEIKDMVTTTVQAEIQFLDTFGYKLFFDDLYSQELE